MKNGFLLVFLLLAITAAYGQDINSVRKEIETKFTSYVINNPWEDVFINTDRVEYISGETLWFAAYVIDRQSSKPSDNSRVLYVELINSSGIPVIQSRVNIKSGSGPGEMSIPDTLSTGCYTLRAYTNYMRNFFPSNCFTLKLNIYNAISVRSSNTISIESDESNTINNKYEASSDAGLTVANIKLTVDSLEILIRSNDNYRLPNSASCILFIETRGNVNYSSVVKLSNETTRHNIARKQLMEGINHLTVFDASGRTVSESYIINKRLSVNNLTEDDSLQFNRREKVNLKFDIQPAEIPAETTVLSVSVTPLAGNKTKGKLPDYVFFGTEFGKISDEERMVIMKDINIPEQIVLPSRFRSSWINWENVLSADQPALKFPREKEEHYISGRLLKKETGLPVSGEFLFLSTPGKKAVFQYSITDNAGNFEFAIPVTGAEQDIIIQPEVVDKNYSIELFSTYQQESENSKSAVKFNEIKIPDYINKSGVNYQVNRIYGISDTRTDEKRTAKLPEPARFYGKPDISLIMDDYIKLPVMEEVFFELLPGVSMKTRKSKTEITLIGSTEYLTYSKPPALFIDGVVINDAAVIGNLDPETVEEIDVIKERYTVGDYIFYGLVNVITRTGDFSHVTLPDYAMRLKYLVFDPVPLFNSPDYSSIQNGPDKIPDFRNTLYWNPSLKPAPDGKIYTEFWTSDLPGEYVVNLQGFTGDGKPVSVTRIISVK